MTTWEYKLVYAPNKIMPTGGKSTPTMEEADLGEIGAEGWELVDVTLTQPGRGGTWVYHFKRPVVTQATGPQPVPAEGAPSA